MKKISIGWLRLIAIFSIVLFMMYIESDLFFALFFLLIFAFPFIFALKYKDKLYYLHSKTTGEGGLKIYFLFALVSVYCFAFVAFFFINPSLSDIPFIILWLLFLNLSGIYLASKKNFLIFFNKKMDAFPIRLFFLIPGTFALNFGFAFLTYLLYLIVVMIAALMSASYPDGLNEIGISGLIILSIIGNLLTITYFKKYILRDDLPSEYRTDFMEYELYVFMPADKRISDHDAYDMPKKIQVRDLRINSKKIDSINLFSKIYSPHFSETALSYEDLKKDLLFTRFGALIVSNKMIEMFEKNNLTGYQLRNIWDEKTKRNLSTHFQLVSTSEMPQMSSQTKIKRGLLGGALIPDAKVYYDSFVLNHVSDFNQTSEYIGTIFGNPYFHQKIWIVSKKATEILINQFGRQKKEFIPIMLVDDEKKNKIGL